MATIIGNGKKKALKGTDDADLIVGHRLGEKIEGRGGDDHILGGHGNDTVDGGAGSDRIEGGDGADELAGGGVEPDTFVWNTAQESPNVAGERDKIIDFKAGDRLDFSLVAANSGIPITPDMIEVSAFGDGWLVVVHHVAGDSRWDLGVEVLGVEPTAANFTL